MQHQPEWHANSKINSSQEYGGELGSKSFFEEFPEWKQEPIMDNFLAYSESLAGESGNPINRFHYNKTRGESRGYAGEKHYPATAPRP